MSLADERQDRLCHGHGSQHVYFQHSLDRFDGDPLDGPGRDKDAGVVHHPVEAASFDVLCDYGRSLGNALGIGNIQSHWHDILAFRPECGHRLFEEAAGEATVPIFVQHVCKVIAKSRVASGDVEPAQSHPVT
jgi:hypothetical protein